MGTELQEKEGKTCRMCLKGSNSDRFYKGWGCEERGRMAKSNVLVCFH